MERDQDFNVDIENLSSENPTDRRMVAEKYLSEELPDAVAKIMVDRLLDDDIGVRDAVSSTLIYSSNQNIAQYVVPFVASPIIASRNLAGEILLKRGASSIPAMIQHLPDGNDDDKKFIIDVLGLIGDPSVGKDIIEVLKTSENDNVILACLEGLGNIKYEAGVKEIIKKYDENENFQPTVIEALGKIGSEESLNFIMDKYHEVDELTKFSMIETFGFIGNTSSFFLLLSELRNMYGALTWAAIESLKKLKDKFQLDVPFDENMKNSILSTLLDGDLQHKRAAAHLVSAFEDKDIIEASLKIFNQDSEIDENIKSKFFENPNYLYPKLTEYLSTSPGNLKALFGLIMEMIEADGGESLYAQSEFDKRAMSNMFADNLEHPDEEVRRSAIELLFFCDTETAIMFLDTMIDDDDFWNRMRVLEIIGSINDPRALDSAKKLLEDSEEMVRERATQVVEMYENNN